MGHASSFTHTHTSLQTGATKGMEWESEREGLHGARGYAIICVCVCVCVCVYMCVCVYVCFYLSLTHSHAHTHTHTHALVFFWGVLVS